MEPSVLVIDDDKTMFLLARKLLSRHGYSVRGASDAHQGLALALSKPPDIILLDYMMPEKNGLALLADMRAIPKLSSIPIIMITACYDDADVRAKAIQGGITELLPKPCDLDLLVKVVKKWAPPRGNYPGEREPSRPQAHEAEDRTQLIADLSVRLARSLGMSEEEQEYVLCGALLHDIGEMALPGSILHKAGSLSEQEWETMRRHPVNAYELLSHSTYLRPVIDIPYCHHEKWDGTGYPRGLQGEQIPLPARIFAVVDVWNALRSARPHRNAWEEEEALAHLSAQAGTHFDPRVVQKFWQVLD